MAMGVASKFALVIALLLLVGGGLWFVTSQGLIPNIPNPITPGPSFKNDPLTKLEKFKSEQDFKDYLSKSPSPGGFGLGGVTAFRESLPTTNGMAPALKATDQASAPEPQRYSQTNVQVAGIDEPDIVKTDGKEIYVSSPVQYFLMRSGGSTTPGVMSPNSAVAEDQPAKMIAPSDPQIFPPRPPQNTGGVKAVKAFPPQNLKVDKTLDQTGDLLLAGNNLIILGNQYPRKIFSYDVSNPSSPQKKWTYELKDNNEIVGSRLSGNKIYLVTRTQLNSVNPCPVIPLMVRGSPLTIPCVDIYHPVTPVPADVTYTAFVIDTESGNVEKNVSFVGSSSDSVIYMSPNALYISYFDPGDFLSYFVSFLNDNSDLFPLEVRNRLTKLKDYDISSQAKMTELSQILEQYQSSLDNDARLKLENEMQNRMDSYGKKHNRDLGQTGLVKISVNGLNIQATGTIPGHPLNQFSLDEFQNNLRIATTVGDNNWWGWRGNQQNNANDVYILDSNLNITGKITDLGLTERIYSARLIGNRGYLVTFRQTDPFYVLDLSNPSAPKMAGQLKIPGFSSYLHPLKDDQILGVGQENGKVKLSLFDVSNSSNPQELAKYNLDDYWTEVSNNFHAFQQDAKHQIFFLPGGQGAYVFSYEGNNLKLIKALSQIQSRRALYINDYLFIVGDSKITVLDENSWNKVKELDL